jgi:hypothetical protein
VYKPVIHNLPEELRIDELSASIVFNLVAFLIVVEVGKHFAFHIFGAKPIGRAKRIVGKSIAVTVV